MSGFQSPNYTQTPNDLFDELLPEMGLAELKVVMCIVRHTFGFHQDETKLSIRTIARYTGLTVKSVMEGAKQAEEHGLIERYTDHNKTTKWRAIVSVVPSSTPRNRRYNAGVSPATTQLGVKESRKKESNKSTPLSIENAIATNQTVTNEMLQKATIQEIAPRQFENALGFSKPLPWWTGKDWVAFSEWVCQKYEESKTIFAEYNIWRNTPYTKGGMSNNRIRGFVKEFYDSWDMFMMSRKSNPVTPIKPITEQPDQDWRNGLVLS